MTPVDLRALLEAAPKMIPLAEFDGGIGHERCGTACLYEPVCPSPADNEARAALIVAAVNSLPHLLDRIVELEAALQFYAEQGTWDEDGRAWLAPFEGESDEDRGAVARAALSALDEQKPPPCKECGGPTVFYDDTPSRRLFKCEACSTPENYRWTTVPREQEPR